MTLAECVMRGRLVSGAGRGRAARFFAPTGRPRMRDLIEEWFESSEAVEFRRTTQLLAAESAAAVRRLVVRVGERVSERVVEGVAAICAFRFSGGGFGWGPGPG